MFQLFVFNFRGKEKKGLDGFYESDETVESVSAIVWTLRYNKPIGRVIVSVALSVIGESIVPRLHFVFVFPYFSPPDLLFWCFGEFFGFKSPKCFDIYKRCRGRVSVQNFFTLNPMEFHIHVDSVQTLMHLWP